MPLRLTVDVRNGEPAFSVLARLAARNFCSPAEFCSDVGLRHDAVLDGEPESIAQLAALVGTVTSRIQGATPRHLDAYRTDLGGHVLARARLSGHDLRGCRVCVAEDRATSAEDDATSASIRIEWMHEFCFVCLRHGVWLETLWSDPDVRSRLDTVARFSEAAGMPDAESFEPSAYDRWIVARLRGETGTTWLDDFDLQAAIDICDLLGRSLVREAFPRLGLMSRRDRRQAISRAFDILSQGEAAFRAALRDMQTRGGAPNDGLGRRFGVLYQNLDRYLDGPAYEPFKTILREQIFETWPIATGEEVLGQALPQRRLHSVLTASRETGVPPERLRAILAARGIVSGRGEGTVPAWEMFDAATANDLLRLIARSVTLKELVALLNMSRSQMETLRVAGFLMPDLPGPGHAPLWDPEAAVRFLTDLTRDALIVAEDDPSWEEIGSAALRLRVSPGNILKLRLTGQLRLGRRSGLDGYGSLVVRPVDVVTAKAGIGDYLNIEAFAKKVGLRWPEARRLVTLGLTPSTRLRNPASGAMQDYIGPEDLAAFHDRYATLMTLSAERGERWQATRIWLQGTGVPRVLADGRNFGQLYNRAAFREALARDQ